MAVVPVLFAAGRGVRLRPLTDHVPKAALPVLDVALGAWGLSALLEAGSPVLINVSHLDEGVIEALAPVGAASVRFLREHPTPLGTGGTLVGLRDEVASTVLTWNSDLITDLRASDLLETHVSSGAFATVALALVDEGADFEIDGRATRFIDRRSRPRAPGGLFLGAAAFEPAALQLLPDRAPQGLAEALLRPLADRGELGVHLHGGYAIDVGTPRRYLQASLDALQGRSPPPPGGPPGEVVNLSPGRAYVGPGARVAPGGLGRDAVLSRGCIVEDGARVSRAVVWPGEVVPRGERVEDTIWAFGRRLIG